LLRSAMFLPPYEVVWCMFRVDNPLPSWVAWGAYATPLAVLHRPIFTIGLALCVP